MSTTRTPTRKRGRPTKRTPHLTKEVLEYISDGLPLKDAAALAGISYNTFNEWRKEFPYFRESIEGAMAKGVAARLSLIREATEGGDTASARWWLEHVRPESFAKNRVEVAHKHEGAVNHVHSVDDATLERIAEARRRYESGNSG